MHVEFVPPAEALVAQLAFKGLLTWMEDGKLNVSIPGLRRKEHHMCKEMAYRCGF